MNKKIIMAIAVFVILVGGFYFLTQKSNYSLIQSNEDTTGQQTQSAANVVTIKNFAFTPETITVTQGITVTWTNEDAAVHTIKSDTFSSQDLNRGGKFEFTFDKKGTFDYSCGVHPYMKGAVIVE